MDHDSNGVLVEASKSHTAIVGKTGSGKTCTAKLMIERVVGGSGRVCILDPIKSDYWGLVSSGDGKRPGLPFHILGGPRAHVPLHPGAGKAVGRVVGSGSLPLSIIDMADFPMGGLSEFFTHFAAFAARTKTLATCANIVRKHFPTPPAITGTHT